MALIECDDYDVVGPFKPVSFKPVLSWRIIISEVIPESRRLLRRMTIGTTVQCFALTVTSLPYEVGEFVMDAYDLGFGGIYLSTNDPEEAVYLAEQYLKCCGVKKL